MFAFDFDELENKSPVPAEQVEIKGKASSRVSSSAGGQKHKDVSPEPNESSTDSTGLGGKVPLSMHQQRLRQWHLTADSICRMIHEMRDRECVAGKGWMEGMQQLIENTPKDHVGRRYGLDEFAGPLLRDHFIQWTAAHSRAANFRRVILRMEMKVVVATKHLDLSYDWTLRQGAFGPETEKMAEALGATKSPPFDGFMHMKRGLLFVGLPLRLYLADSPHLYELLRRMRRLAEPAAEDPSVASIRAALDADGQPYAVLVYAMFAALQTLHAARLTGGRAGTGAQGLDAFCATARREGETFEVKEVDQNCSLIFRGIWVPRRIDEHRAAYTWTFNSFSRSVEGVMWVLDFYAVEPTGNQEVASLAWEESHILLYVARFHATSSVWAFPVQFFNSGQAADVEKEVVVLPFVEYEFEKIQGTMYEIRSSMSSAMKRSALAQMESRWSVSFKEQAPLLLQLLEGEGFREYGGLNRKLKVSVRFVKAIKPCKPISKMMSAASGAPEELLLAFPPKDPEAAKDAKSIFGAGYAELNQMVDMGSLKPLGTSSFIPGKKIAAGL